MSFASRLPPGAEAGATNLMCPNCEHRIGVVQLLRHLEQQNIPLRDITPNSYTPCPACAALFFPENAFLVCLSDIADTGDSYRSYPFGIAGHQGVNYTDVTVGETSEHKLSNLYQGYEIERGSLILQGAERSDVDQDDRLPIDRHEDSMTRATLADILLVSVTQVAPRQVLVTANLRKDEDAQDAIAKGDDITLIYQRNLLQTEGRDPPWLTLLREAKSAINRDNPLAAGPLLVSAVDNCLYRQIYLYYRWQGQDHTEAINSVDQYRTGNKISRKDLAKDALNDISGVTLTSHEDPYFDEWNRFQTFLQQRHDIIHPTDDPVPAIDTDTAVDWFNLTVDLILGHFDLVWREID